MPIYTDGVLIQECGGVKTDTVNMELVQADSTTVYDEVCCTPGSASFTSPGTYTWKCPQYVTRIDLNMIAGGGGGSCDVDPSSVDGQTGGGYQGQHTQQSVTVTPGGSYTIVVGFGGTGGIPHGNGGSGGNSQFGTIVANGGAGGTWSDTGSGAYQGNGAIACGSYKDGIMSRWESGTSWGGQGSCFGNGGGGGNGDYGNGGAGGVGAGGGGMHSRSSSSRGGTGGRGQVLITWDCT